jgi:hypothetical protein
LQIGDELGPARSERDLRQEPERLDEGWVVSGLPEVGLGGCGGGCRDRCDIGAQTQQFDDLPPFPGRWQCAEPYVAHAASSPSGRVLRPATGRKAKCQI